MTTPADAVRGTVLVVFATTMLAGCGSDPGATPTASPSTAASASPTTSPTATPIVAAFTGGVTPGEVTIDPTLPDALPLPEGIWEQTGPGWVLATYRPSYTTWHEYEVTSEVPESAKFVIYLMSPEGQRYQVLELDSDRSITLLSWTAGESRAIVEEQVGPGGGVWEVAYEYLDLTTGEATPFQAPSSWLVVKVATSDSVRIWGDQAANMGYIEREGEFTPLAEGWLPAGQALSPDGEWIAVHGIGIEGGGLPVPIGAARISTGEITSFPELDSLGYCSFHGWADSGALLVSCNPGDEDHHQYFEAEPSTGTVAESSYVAPADDPLGLYHDFWMSPGVWAGNAGRVPGTPFFGVGVEDHGTVTELHFFDKNGNPLDSPHLVAAVDGILYVEEGSGAAETVVLAYDPSTDRQTILLTCPPSPPDLDPNTFLSASVLWVVAP